MGVLKARVGGAWVPVSQGFDLSSAGYVGHAYASAAVTNQNGTADVPGCSVTWTAIAGHIYKTTFVVGSMSLLAANGQGYAIIANAANTQFRSAVADAAVGQALAFSVVLVETGLSGTQTRKGRLSATAANWSSNGTTEYGPMILVEDITAVSPGGVVPVVPWTAPTLQGTWANFDAALYSPAGYRLINDIVFLRGLLKLGAAGSTIFTLPVGYRPPRSIHSVMVANDAIGVVRSQADGQVVLTTGSVAGWVSLEGVQFSVTL